MTITKYTMGKRHKHISEELHNRENEIIILLIRYHVGNRTIPIDKIIKYMYSYYELFKEFYKYY